MTEPFLVTSRHYCRSRWPTAGQGSAARSRISSIAVSWRRGNELRDLIERAKAGDLEAFGRLVERFQDGVYGAAYAMLGDFDDAQDVAQEVFVQAWRDVRTITDPAKFAAWLYGITRNRCRDFLRRPRLHTRPVEQSEHALAASAETDPVARLEKAEIRDAVVAAIRRLSEPNRLATTLFYINDYSIEEVAEFLEVPAGTVKRRLHDSRQQLKQRMVGMVEQHLQAHRLSPEFKQEILKRIGHWERFGGSTEEKLKMVQTDPEWVRLMELELELEPMSAECKMIRQQIACFEPCHESYLDNVKMVLEMIGAMIPGRIMDCGQACAARQEQAKAYRKALQTWRDQDHLPDNADQYARDAFDLLGERTEAKLPLVEHLIGKLGDDTYQVYADDDEDFGRIESRIHHLEICNYNWKRNLRIVLQEIAAGRRLFDWHGPDGYNAHGDYPNRVPELQEMMAAAATWAEGNADKAGRWGRILGEATPEKRWLVFSLCKNVSAQHDKFEGRRLLARPAL